MMSWGKSVADDNWIFESFKEGFFTGREQDHVPPMNLNQNLIGWLPPFGKNGTPKKKYREGSELRIIPEKMVLRYTYHPKAKRVDQTIPDERFDYDSLLEASKKLYRRVDNGIVNKLFGGENE